MAVRLADIATAAAGERCYDVTVDGVSRHRVSVPMRFGNEDVERVVRVSFEFLLEREPASAILAEFSLDVIGRSTRPSCRAGWADGSVCAV